MSLTLSPRRPVIPRARPSLLLEPVVTPSPLKQAKVSQAPQEPVTAAKSTCVLSALSPEPVWAPPPPSRSKAVATPTASSSQQKDKAAYKSWSGRWIGMEGPLRELLALCGRVRLVSPAQLQFPLIPCITIKLACNCISQKTVCPPSSCTARLEQGKLEWSLTSCLILASP
jgi:hypothetical protein